MTDVTHFYVTFPRVASCLKTRVFFLILCSVTETLNPFCLSLQDGTGPSSSLAAFGSHAEESGGLHEGSYKQERPSGVSCLSKIQRVLFILFICLLVLHTEEVNRFNFNLN